MHEPILATMTKAQVIHAIEVETNLMPGMWIELPDEGEPDETNCAVCAVGAVLWGAAVPPEKIYRVADVLTGHGSISDSFWLEGEEIEATKASPLAALSRAFESSFDSAYGTRLSTKRAIEKARKAAICFVNKYFPPKIAFKYNGRTAWVEK